MGLAATQTSGFSKLIPIAVYSIPLFDAQPSDLTISSEPPHEKESVEALESLDGDIRIDIP